MALSLQVGLAWPTVGCRLGRETQSCRGVGGGGINIVMMTGTSSDVHGMISRGQAPFYEDSMFYVFVCSFIPQNTPKG